jgi:two-component system catabolic regulation response regulator CreB
LRRGGTGNVAQKILIIEDESSIADNISFILETEGFETLWRSTAGDGKAALDELEVALVVLDIGLPDMNGMELCKEIRKTADVPIIFLTARADEIDRIVGLEIGADDYVTKPFSPRELAARVKAVLRRTSNSFICEDESGDAVSLGAFEIDSSKRLISFRKEALKLSRYEYEILKLMLEHPGRVYSRKQLMEAIWEEPETSMERTVDTHIKTIRAKLKSIEPEKEIVATHRGFGYSISETR